MGRKVTFRVIVPSLRIAPAVVLAVVVLVRNVTAAARLATLRVHAPRHPEEVQEEATAVVGEEEGTAPLAVVVVVAAVKKLVTRAEG